MMDTYNFSGLSYLESKTLLDSIIKEATAICSENEQFFVVVDDITVDGSGGIVESRSITISRKYSDVVQIINNKEYSSDDVELFIMELTNGEFRKCSVKHKCYNGNGYSSWAQCSFMTIETHFLARTLIDTTATINILL